MGGREGKIALAARWVAPMDRPLLRDAAVVMEDGAIVEVGPTDVLRMAHPEAKWEELGEAVLLPGIINAHTHLELSLFDAGGNGGGAPPRQREGIEEGGGQDPWRGRDAPATASSGDFQRAGTEPILGGPTPQSLGQWVAGIVARRATGDPEAAARAGARAGRDESLGFGVTCVGDITRYPSATRKVLRDGPLRVVSFGEIQSMAARRGLLESRLAAATEASAGSALLRIAVSPHAPYTVEPAAYRRCLEVARQRNLPLATHLAESADEALFLADHTGDFRALWEALGAWDDQVPRYVGGPILLAAELGLLSDPRVLLAHVNHCDDEELDLLAGGVASVVFCPRTHAYFGQPPHRWREMLERGVNVCVGTDSRASAPDLDVLAELRMLHRHCPDESPARLFSMVTLRAAKALDAGDSLGSLTPGKRGDVVAFAVDGPTREPLGRLLEAPGRPIGVWIEGQAVGKGRKGAK